MANNDGRRIATTRPSSQKPSSLSGIEEDVESPTPVLDFLPQALLERELRFQLRKIRERIDSPKTLLILRNATLTLLELNDAKLFKEGKMPRLDAASLVSLLSDSEFREMILGRLVSTTPDYWDENWNHAWTKDADPLYSERQQRIMTRRSLISFWRNEWSTLPSEQVEQAMQVAKSLVSE